MSKEDNNSMEEEQSTAAGLDEKEKAILHTMQQHFDFSLKLLRSLASDKKGESSIVSPVSVAISLAMVYGGASGETAKQIAQLLPKREL
jgi:serine protease inhibitor